MDKLNINFRDAALDLIWLLDRGYPKKPAIEIVGNKCRLNHRERMTLYRGIFDTEGASRRKTKLIDPLTSPPQILLIDCNNIVITISSYLKGMPVFRALDGYVRDVSEVFGSVKITNPVKRSIDALMSFIMDLDLKTEVHILLDKSKKENDGSKNLRSYIESKTQNIQQSITVRTLKSVDREIRNSVEPYTAVASSDTRIIEMAHKTVDIPDYIITNVFRHEILDLQHIFK